MGYDEPFEIPSEEAVTLSLRTQQIIALESGVTRTADPLAGSFFVEWLTDELESRARTVLATIEEEGGAIAAIERGIPQRWIAESAYRIERETASRERKKVGVNIYAEPDGTTSRPRLFELDEGVIERQIARTEDRIAARDATSHGRAMRALERVTRHGDNVMPALIEATRAGATVGEMTDVFREAFGEFREPAPW
jgi:methylmalonyl-CoA mutase N-terminal domain/subunit